MSDTDTETDTASGKRQLAKREWINAGGDRVPTGDSSVAGVRYTYLPTGRSVEYAFDNSPLTRQFAAMGCVTKLGNVVSSITNAEDYDGSDPMDAVEEWLTEAINGQWREPGAGAARGPKYDKDVLAAAIVAELGAAAKGTLAEYRQRLDDRSYYAKVRNNPEVMARYLREMAARGAGGTSNISALA